jgi:hypothetical protein
LKWALRCGSTRADGSRLDDRIGYRHALLIEPVPASQVTLPSDGSLAVLPGFDAACSERLARHYRARTS